MTESGLYDLALDSRKPEAKRFRRWVTGEVLPAIRKTGRYEVQSPAEDALILQAVGILQGRVEEAEKRAIAAESTVEQQAPFVAFAEQVRASSGDLTISTACTQLGLIPNGKNGIFTWLRRHWWIMQRKRDGVNQPTIKSLACWPWKLSTMGGGYGRASWAGLVMGAHRVAWILTHGAIAKGLFVCHRCSENLCCNPGHLFLGTSSRGRRPPDADARELSSSVLKKDVDKGRAMGLV